MTGHAYLATAGEFDPNIVTDDTEVQNRKWVEVRDIIEGNMELRPFVREVVTDMVKEGVLVIE